MKSLQIENRTFIKKFDLNLIFVIIAISIIGLINLYSATHDIHNTNQWDDVFLTQVVWFLIGYSIFGILTILDYTMLSKLAYPLYILNVLALAAVPLIGKSFYGAKRWLDLGFFKYQPSETMKIVLVITLAKMFSDKSYPNGLGLKNLLFPVLLMGIPFGLTVKQPDLGTGMLIFFVGASMIFFIGIRRNVLITFLALALVVIPVAWKVGLIRDYQKNRIHTFLDPNTDPRGAGYNSIQSKIAVGSGKFFGKGFRKGTQSQLNFLPEHHTDFIYSVLSEENGFVGSVTALFLFVILILISLKIASQARDKFGALLVVGGISIVFWHAFINIGMVIGLLPIVGIPLPLMSYGGSIMITTMTCLGIVSSVSMRKFIF